MKRVSYLLILLAAAACSAAMGIMTYYSAVEDDAAGQRELQTLQALEQESWYLPLDDAYDSIHEINGAEKELYGARYEDREVLMDKRGNVLLKIPKERSAFEPQKGWIPSEMDSDGEGDGLLRFYDSEKKQYGFMDLEGNTVIKASYTQATDFADGYAVIQDEMEGHQNIMAVIDRSGRIIYDPTKEGQWYEWFSKVKRLGGGLFLLTSERGGKYRILDAKENQVIKEIEGAGVFDLEPLGEGRCARFDDEDQMQLLDEDFDPVSEDTFVWMDGFSEGLCFARWKEGIETVSGYVDADGKARIAAGDALYGSRFKEGKAFLWTKDRVRVIDTAGRILFEKELSKELNETDYQLNSRYDEAPAETAPCWFRNGLAICYDGSCYGILDERGKWLIQPVMDDAAFCGKDAAAVRLGVKEGILKVGEKDEG